MFYFELLKSNNDQTFRSNCIDAITDHVDYFISTKNANGLQVLFFTFDKYFKYVIEQRNISEEFKYCNLKESEKLDIYTAETYYDKNVIDLHNTIFTKSQEDVIFLSSALQSLKSLIHILSSKNLCLKINNYIIFNIIESRIMVNSNIINVEYSKLWLDLLLDSHLLRNLLHLKYDRFDAFCSEIGIFLSELIKSQCFTFSECNSFIIFIRVALNKAKSNYQNKNDFILKDKHFIYLFKLMLSVKKDAMENYTILENKWKYDAILKFANEIEEKSNFIISYKKDIIINKLKLSNQKFKSHKYYPLLEEEE